MPRAQAGVAAAIATTSRQVGQTLGVAVAGAIVTAHAGGAGLATASHPAWWTLTACGVVVLALGLLATTGGRRRRPSGPPRSSTRKRSH